MKYRHLRGFLVGPRVAELFVAMGSVRVPAIDNSLPSSGTSGRAVLCSPGGAEEEEV